MYQQQKREYFGSETLVPKCINSQKREYFGSETILVYMMVVDNLLSINVVFFLQTKIIVKNWKISFDGSNISFSDN